MSVCITREGDGYVATVEGIKITSPERSTVIRTALDIYGLKDKSK